MKIRTSLRAGAKGCSPEAQYYMEKALAMEATIEKCRGNNYYNYYPTTPSTPPNYVGSGYTYPDMSGYCG
jgi:hypothetical protein